VAANLILRIWGARGTIPSPGDEQRRYGGNTTCLVLAVSEDEYVVLDCGSGLRIFGKSLPQRKDARRRFHVLLSHYHFDHVEGLPYFSPLFDAGNRFHFYGLESEGRTTREALEGFIRPPYFPVSLAGTPAELHYERAGERVLEFGDVRADCVPLNHPDGSLAWRLSRGDRRIVLATDHEHGRPEIDDALERFAEGADVLIYDATYIPSEYEALRRGWGHSTWYAAVALARKVGVRQLVLFHHHPDHSDEELERLLTFAKADFPGTELAREGMEFLL